MNHVGIIKAAHHVHNRIGFTDVRQKLVAKPFAFAGTGHQAGNIYKFHRGRHNALGLNDGGQLL
jgi:hypothetical protein